MRQFISFTFFLSALCLSVVFIDSCKKSSNGGNGNSPADKYYVKFKVDGTLKTYSGDAEGNFNVESSVGNYVSTIYGVDKIFVADTSALDIGISNTANLAANITYTNYATTTGGQLKPTLVILSYYDESGNFFAAWPDDYSAFGVISDAKIIITSATSTSLKGNFSGTVYKEIDGTSPKHIISEGEFYVKRIN